jgi:hypothetical protein
MITNFSMFIEVENDEKNIRSQTQKLINRNHCALSSSTYLKLQENRDTELKNFLFFSETMPSLLLSEHNYLHSQSLK